MAEKSRLDLSEQRFTLLINAITDYAIYMLNLDGTVASWNAGARRLKGYEPDEIIGQDFSVFFTPEDRAAGTPHRALKAAAAEGRFEAEGWRIRKDGTRFWANVVLDPIRDEDGTLIGYAKITRDITERRAAEQALSRSEQRFRMLVQGVRDYAIYLLDPQGYVSNWNAGAEAIKGYSAGEITGSHFSCFYTEEDRAAGEPARALATARSEGKYESQAWRVRKDGSHFFAHVVIDPISDDDGNPIGFAKITRDITEHRRAQEELEETRANLFQAQKLQALGELTGGIAHDFNNLMTVIRGSAELLSNHDLPPEKRMRYTNAIIDTADRAATLTNHLLSFGRRQSLKPEVINLNLRLDALGEVLARTLGARIDVRLSLAEGPSLIEVDSAQLETALLNAAFNARDAMPGGGTLTLSTQSIRDRDHAEFICISIADTGEGMPEDVAARAFEPFFTTKAPGKGTGLGLSQIHGFVAQSGGHAAIESRPGEGTAIQLFLPRSPKPVGAASSPRKPQRHSGGKQILLVEDNDQVREFVQALVESIGNTAISAASAEEAISILAQSKPDILFSDIVMPGQSGLALARSARQLYPDLPILLATGYSEEIIETASEFELLKKPYSRRTLEEALARLLPDRPDS